MKARSEEITRELEEKASLSELGKVKVKCTFCDGKGYTEEKLWAGDC